MLFTILFLEIGELFFSLIDFSCLMFIILSLTILLELYFRLIGYYLVGVIFQLLIGYYLVGVIFQLLIGY